MQPGTHGDPDGGRVADAAAVGESAGAARAAPAGGRLSWLRRQGAGRNRYDLGELAGAFGDIGTLIPFAAGYIAVAHVAPLGILFTLGIGAIVVGLYYRTPVPVQPMKAIGAAVIASGGALTAAQICGAGLFTGLFWLLAGATGTIDLVTRLAARPIVRGIVLGLGLLFIAQGIGLMLVSPWLGGIGLVLTLALLRRPRFPAMFGLLLLGAAAASVLDPAGVKQVLLMRPDFRLPELTLGRMTFADLAVGTFALAVPQLPLTIGNAIIAIRAEHNGLFPDRPVNDRMLAVSQGVINLFAAPLGGIPLCHGAGGLAGHVRFGARTGGSLVMLGVIVTSLALFFSNSVALLFQVFPRAVLGVILFFAGAELALTARGNAGHRKQDIFVTLVVAGLAVWNMGAAFLAGIILHEGLRQRGPTV